MKKIIISGLGLIGHKHADIIAKRHDCRVFAVINQVDSPTLAFSARTGAKIYNFSEFESCLDTECPDGVVISSPNMAHFDQAAACIRRGIPVLVEKPLTDRIETALALSQMERDSGARVLVGHHRTYSPLLGAASQFLNSAAFGTLVAVQGSALFYKPTSYFEAGLWRTKIGGGPILINLIHEIGLMRHFCGEITSLFAFSSHQTRGFEVEDTVALALKFKSGCLGTFILSDCAASCKSWEMTSGENPAYPFFPNEACYHFAGTSASLDFPSMNVHHYDHKREGSWWMPLMEHRLPTERADPLELQMDHFLKVIEGAEQPRVPASEGYKNIRVLEAISKSIADHAPVEIADEPNSVR